MWVAPQRRRSTTSGPPPEATTARPPAATTAAAKSTVARAGPFGIMSGTTWRTPRRADTALQASMLWVSPAAASCRLMLGLAS